MTRICAPVVLSLVALFPAFGQPPPSAVQFEVASVKLSPQPDPAKAMHVGMSGGPGTDDPGRATFQNFTLSNLVNVAFATDRNHVSGPGEMDGRMFDIAVKIPDGTTSEQFQLMLQNLLVERFHLMFHYQKKEATTYELVVAKNGPKFRESAEGTSNPARTGQDGFPILPEGRGRATIMTKGRARTRLPEESMDGLAQMLSGPAGSPVANVTGLKGKYDINLYWATNRLRADARDAESGPTIFDAVQEQLGLKLEPKKGVIDVLVIDHVDRVPTEN
jgi:uncharacterized protein (TIGR03435 family)